MKKKPEPVESKKLRNIIIIAVVLVLLVLNYFHFMKKISSNKELVSNFQIQEDPMEKYRNPAVAGLFYAADAKDLERDVSHYLDNAGEDASGGKPKILIVPHAGYPYSAPAAAKAYARLEPYAGTIKTVILLGPSHHVYLEGAALSGDDSFKSPLGKIPINKKITAELAKKSGFSYKYKAHAKEHSLEVQLPFLQKVLPKANIVPIVYGNVNPQELAEALKPYLQREDTLLLVSADLSHYNNYNDAKKLDENTAKKIETGQADIDYHHSCGAGGINTALVLSYKMHLKPNILSLINSGDTAGDKNRVVGYGAWAFEGEGWVSEIEQQVAAISAFTNIYREQLLSVARTALNEAVLYNRVYKPSRDDYAEEMFNKGAVFVTLAENKELRGCIGSLTPSRAIALDIADNTYNAAMKDSRFDKVSKEELDNINISISILTGFEKMDFVDEADLLNQIEAGVDGIVIRDGYRQGLFLPSVWEQLPDKKDFLSNLKIKAGLSPSYWSDSLRVFRFRTVEIEEETGL